MGCLRSIQTANVLFAVEATHRWSSDGIVANALMPGGISTNLERHIPRETNDGWVEMEKAGQITMKATQQGAATTLAAAVAPEFAHTGGHYLEDCNEAETVADARMSSGVREWALDPSAANRLWDTSVSLLDDV